MARKKKVKVSELEAYKKDLAHNISSFARSLIREMSDHINTLIVISDIDVRSLMRNQEKEESKKPKKRIVKRKKKAHNKKA